MYIYIQRERDGQRERGRERGKHKHFLTNALLVCKKYSTHGVPFCNVFTQKRCADPFVCGGRGDRGSGGFRKRLGRSSERAPQEHSAMDAARCAPQHERIMNDMQNMNVNERLQRHELFMCLFIYVFMFIYIFMYL